MKNKTAKMIPLIAAGIVPATVTSALLSPLALGATGDLDPSFGDVGRLGPILNGPAWSLEPLEDATILLAGGNSYYHGYYEAMATNFVTRLSDTGSLGPSFTASILGDTQVLDVVRQPDGQVVAVGRQIGSTGTFFGTTWHLVVFRLRSNGPLDSTFGTDGIFELSGAEYESGGIGTSVVLDPDGRIVVAGSRSDHRVIVLRLLPDGSIDDSFGTSGVFTGPVTRRFSPSDSGAGTSLLRTAAGGYRVTASNQGGCRIVALTADGAIDKAFGSAGIATIDNPSGPSTYCNSMVSQANGRLLLAGSAAGQGFAARMRADGQSDPGFSADAVSDALEEATAVAAGLDGSVIVAGRGVSGASVMRLLANGELDPLFGNAGSTLIDLRSESGTAPVVHDLIVRADGRVVAAGGEGSQAFVVRLLGAAGGDSPGVLGVTGQTLIPANDEGTDEVVVNVRRTGGAFGSVSVAYESAASTFSTATAGQDYDPVAGRLIWADGDTTEQQVRVAILADNSVEGREYFRVRLSDAQGGAGLGTFSATVEIAAEGSPFGQLHVPGNEILVNEGRSVRVDVLRSYYFSGAVSVTLTPIPGTATAGDDFTANAVTLSWADGESNSKFVEFAIVDDALAEITEHFTVELSNPTGGAIIPQANKATVSILANDQPPRQPPASRGGGAFDYLSLLLLGVMTFLRSPRTAIRSRLAALFG